MAVTITENAKKEIYHVIEEQKSQETSDSKYYLRVRVVGGGCSGFQYKLTIENEVNEKLDEFHEINQVPVVIDKRSMMYIDGATIDYLNDLNERGFKVTNPQAKSTCGCGSSFSL